MKTYDGRKMAKIARKAADLIEENGLACAEMKTTDGALCTMGSVMAAAGVELPEDNSWAWYGYVNANPNKSASRVIEQLALRIGVPDNLSGGNGNKYEYTVQDWSDGHEDADLAIKLLRDAAVDFEENVFL